MIKKRYPHARLAFLSFAANSELLDRIDLIDEIHTINTTSIMAFCRDTVRCFRNFFWVGFDIVFDFEFFSKFSTLITALTFASCRAGFSLPTFWRSSIYTHQILLDKRVHVKDSFCRLVTTVTGEEEIPGVSPPRVTQRDDESLGSKVAFSIRPAVGINVNTGATFLERRWDIQRFADLVSTLSVDGDYEFFFTGSLEERPYVQKAINLTRCRERCHNVAGLLTIGELCALFRRLEIFISNDSGPLHLAAVTGAPTIGLYGPESPIFYGPLGPTVAEIYEKAPCSPCMNIYRAKAFRCPFDAKCMKMIEVKRIQQAVESMLVSV
ncbi:MAG: glycosyltransferase family 9 protein [Ignavibacteriales bacterium]|nr:glycosyltransferase family 9 protein [Ignavibacteriales bacterium]